LKNWYSKYNCNFNIFKDDINLFRNKRVNDIPQKIIC
jgi:hypothetical protein